MANASNSVDSAVILSEAALAAPDICALPAGRLAFFTNPAEGRTGPNEDGLAVIPISEERLVLAVADGLGGLPGGATAARIALQALAGELMAMTPQESLRDIILNGFEAANTQVQQEAAGAATTLAVVEIDASQMRSYHVGDSAVLAVGQRGKLILQTIAHSPVGYAVEAGLLEEQEAMHHAERHIVSNIVGCAEMRIEIGPALPIKPLDTILLATDGLTDNLHAAEIVESIRKGPLEKVSRQLRDTCKERMATAGGPHPSKLDDLTFILYRPPQQHRAR